MKSLLDSIYIIDGVQAALTPAQILGTGGRGCCAESVIDETSDPDPGVPCFHSSLFSSYTGLVSAAAREYPKPFSGDYSKFRVASALIDAIWRKGHFSIGDLEVNAFWGWNDSAVGNMAAFYRSVEAVADYVDSLGLKLGKRCVEECSSLEFRATASLSDFMSDEEAFASQPFRTDNPEMSDVCIPCTADPDPQSWIVYIPFETSEYRLGGSLLSQASGKPCGVCPQIGDSDYFLDCHEVVRELVEDGVVVAGTTVADGGLSLALGRFFGQSGNQDSCDLGIRADVSDMVRAFNEPDTMSLLFSEVPGVLVQIRDIDYDYLDAELLLQDVLYFPLGHPQAGCPVSVKSSSKSGIQKILESLIQNRGAEGED